MYFLVTIVIYNILILHGDVDLQNDCFDNIWAVPMYSVADILVHVSRALR